MLRYAALLASLFFGGMTFAGNAPTPARTIHGPGTSPPIHNNIPHNFVRQERMKRLAHNPHGRGRFGAAPRWFAGLLSGGYILWHHHDAPRGYWQCIAFNKKGQSFASFGIDLRQAAAAAANRCEQASGDYHDEACYIPEDFCRLE